MSSLDLTRDWLRSVLRPYPSRDIIQNEVLKLLQRIPSLAVKTDAFTFDSGSTALLLLLHGTLPIVYRGASYHIPVHIWFPHEYPRAPTMVFVVPTKDMGVRKGREVEPGGRVREEALAEVWSRRRDLDSVIGWLTEVFSAVPPVYAKPPEPARGASTSASASSPGPGAGTPPPGHGNGVGSPAMSRSPAGPGAPTLPARPQYGPPQPSEILPQYNQYTATPSPPAIPGHPHPQVQSPSRQSSASYPHAQTPPPQSQSPVPLRPGQQPPIPSRPVVGPPMPMPLSPTGTGTWGAPQQMPPQQMYAQQGYQSPQMQRQQLPPHQQPTQHPEYQYQQQQQYYQQQQPQSPPQVGYQSPPPQLPQQATGYQQHSGYQQPQATGGYQQPLPPAQQYAPQPQPPQPAPPQGQQQWAGYAPGAAPAPAPAPPANTLAPPRTLDLLTSPETSSSGLPLDAPPPVPPSKPPPPSLVHLHAILLPHLTAALPPVMQELSATKSHLVERREDLASGEPAIRDEMARLEAVKKVCDAVGGRLDEVVTKGAERVADLESRGDVSVDEVVCSISIVHNQLVDLVAEDNAISDTIYHVTRALDAERIDLDKYLKAVRSLAREQYMKRALIERISSGMGGSAWSVS